LKVKYGGEGWDGTGDFLGYMRNAARPWMRNTDIRNRLGALGAASTLRDYHNAVFGDEMPAVDRLRRLPEVTGILKSAIKLERKDLNSFGTDDPMGAARVVLRESLTKALGKTYKLNELDAETAETWAFYNCWSLHIAAWNNFKAGPTNLNQGARINRF